VDNTPTKKSSVYNFLEFISNTNENFSNHSRKGNKTMRRIEYQRYPRRDFKKLKWRFFRENKEFFKTSIAMGGGETKTTQKIQHFKQLST